MTENKIIGSVILDYYRVVRMLGSGGMGAVYEAQHIDLQTRHAVKILHGISAMPPEQRAALEGRFLAEARICTTVRHSNLVIATHFVAQTEFGPILVMDYVDGSDYEVVIRKQGALSEHEALHVIDSAAAALEALHAKGIIHRDMKPANLMRENATGNVILMDLGIARDEGDSQNTQGIIGTPAYMPPEQANGGEVCMQSDLYSLGATMLALLSGQVPMRGTSAMNVIQEISLKVFSEGSALGLLADKGASLSAPVRELLRDMTRYDVSARIPTATALRARIQACRMHASQEVDLDVTFLPSVDGVEQPPNTYIGSASTQIQTAAGDVPMTMQVPAHIETAHTETQATTALRMLGGSTTLGMQQIAEPTAVRSQAWIGYVIVLLTVAVGGFLLRDQITQLFVGKNTDTDGLLTNGALSAQSPLTRIYPASGVWPKTLDISVSPSLDPLRLTLVPAGTFRIGSDASAQTDARPRTDITFTNDRYMLVTEFNCETYALFVEQTSDRYNPGLDQFTSEGSSLFARNGMLPVYGVSLMDAQACVSWCSAGSGLKLRIPGEAEWEYAARGPQSFIYPWGNRWLPERSHSDGKDAPAVGAQYAAGVSWCGVHDMAGNMYEWTNDWYDSERYKHIESSNPESEPPRSAETDAVLRGGSYAHGRDMCRSDRRAALRAGVRNKQVGFRLVITADQALATFIDTQQ